MSCSTRKSKIPIVVLSNDVDFLCNLCQAFDGQCARTNRCYGFPDHNVTSFLFDLSNGRQLRVQHVWQAKSVWYADANQGLRVKVRLPAKPRPDKDDDQQWPLVCAVLLHFQSSKSAAAALTTMQQTAADKGEFYWQPLPLNRRQLYSSSTPTLLHIREATGNVFYCGTDGGFNAGVNCVCVHDNVSVLLETDDGEATAV